MTNNKNKCDRALSERLSNEELAFDPIAWDMMEQKLDEKSKGFILWKAPMVYLLSALTLLTAASILYWPTHYSDPLVNNRISEVESTNSNQEEESSMVIVDNNLTDVDSNSGHGVANKSQSELGSAAIRKSNNHNPNFAQVRNSDANNKITSSGFDTSQSSSQSQEFLSKTTDLVERPVSSLVHDASSTVTTQKSNRILLDVESLDNDFNTLDYNRLIDMDLNQVEIVNPIVRPQHQLNITVGGGMTHLDVDAPLIGSALPTAVAKREAFLSLSYLNRVHRNFGIELGLRGTVQTQRLGHYFNAGDYFLQSPQYAKVKVNAYEGKYEAFANAHFFLPLSQRSELDFYAGYYALNPFTPNAAAGSGGSGIPLPGNEEVNLAEVRVTQNRGFFAGGRLNVGLNYNFLTNKLNNVGIGISYMHELLKDAEGTYSYLTTTDETAVRGNLRANGSGFKVQFTYGIGLDLRSWEERKYKQKIDTGLSNPWYLGLRWGTKQYFLEDILSMTLLQPNLQNQYTTFMLGHYINKRMAIESGLEYSNFQVRAPREFIRPQIYKNLNQGVITIPLALRVDVVQKGRVNLYGKGVFSTDFRLNQTVDLYGDNTAFVTDEDKLLLNAGLEAGIDFTLFSGFQLGLQAKYNHAFRRLAQYEYAVSFDENVYEFQQINLRNRYTSFGVELKYMFNR